jgi:hypothetical protein
LTRLAGGDWSETFGGWSLARGALVSLAAAEARAAEAAGARLGRRRAGDVIRRIFDGRDKNQTRRGGYRGGFDDQSIQAGVSSPKRRRLQGLGSPFMSLASRRQRQFFSAVNAICRDWRHICQPIKHNGVNLGPAGQFIGQVNVVY